jgi:hypothetical protein
MSRPRPPRPPADPAHVSAVRSAAAKKRWRKTKNRSKAARREALAPALAARLKKDENNA